MDSQNPLVSVCIVSYNASEYIIEALESVKVQTYQNIELIVADDGSPDNTVELCKKWFAENGDRFVRTEVVVPPHNTGTSANYNRAVKAAKGDWLKIFDGDDFLAPNCVEDNISYVTEHPEAMVVFSEAGRFKNGKREDTVKFYDTFRRSFFDNDLEGQLLRALHNNDMSSATFFIKTQLLKANLYDEKYGLLEDMPKWIDLLRKGNKFYFFDKVTAYYRVGESVMSSNSRYYNLRYLEDWNFYFWNEMIKIMKEYNAKEAYDYQRKCLLLSSITVGLLKNKRTRLNDFLYKVIRRVVYRYMHFELN